MALDLTIPVAGASIALAAAAIRSALLKRPARRAAIPPSKSTQAPTIKGRTSVILGAGVIGLSTAYHLARRRGQKASHRIIVVDIQVDPFAAASKYNSGILSYQWFSNNLRELAEYCYAFYEDLGNNDGDFQNLTGWREFSNFRLVRGDSPSVDGAPDWVAVPEGWHIERDPEDGRAATVNPIGLGAWLLQTCRRNGVEIYNRARILKAQFLKDFTPGRVCIDRDGQITELLCHDLIFAAGAWTPRLFAEIFPNAYIRLHPTTNSGNWIVVKNPLSEEKKQKALGQVIFDDIAGHQLEFVARNDETIWISGLSNTKDCLGDVVEGKVKPDDDDIAALLGYATRFLDSRPPVEQRPSSLDVVETGRTYRPTIDRELPIITRVEASKLCTTEMLEERWDLQGEENDGDGGVFVCSGHGNYGVTLGMGSGKLMSQIIMGDPPDIDISNLGLPRQESKDSLHFCRKQI